MFVFLVQIDQQLSTNFVDDVELICHFVFAQGVANQQLLGMGWQANVQYNIKNAKKAHGQIN
jgi:hypothetical protein